MSPGEALKGIVAALDEAGVEYMLKGSFAGSYHGIPRATQDIDFVVDPTEEELGQLVDLLEAQDYYVSLEAAQEALAVRGQFNAIDRKTGWKIDLIIRKERPFSIEEFSRRRRESPLGFSLEVATAEDVLLAKLEWAKQTGSEQQMADAVGILTSQGESLDRTYVGTWVEELELEDEWKAAQERAHG